MLAYPALIIVIAALSLLTPILALFGFFERRNTDTYQFRTKRFLSVIAALFFLNCASSFLLLNGIKNLLSSGEESAEMSVFRTRAATHQRLTNLSVMFPALLNEETNNCYRSAISNFIEDQWQDAYRKQSCQADAQHCADNESAFFKALIDKARPSQTIGYSLNAMGVLLKMEWKVANDMYTTLRRFTHQPSPKGEIPEPADETMLANYERYFTQCSALKPTSWAQPGTPLLSSRLHYSYE